MNQQTLAPFIWNIADLLLGAFKPSEYGRIICRLPCCAGWSVCWSLFATTYFGYRRITVERPLRLCFSV